MNKGSPGGAASSVKYAVQSYAFDHRSGLREFANGLRPGAPAHKLAPVMTSAFA
jgi:hypothetical protein